MAYYLKNKERIKSRTRHYQANNKEVVNATRRKYYSKNTTAILEYQKRYDELHPEKAIRKGVRKSLPVSSPEIMIDAKVLHLLIKRETRKGVT